MLVCARGPSAIHFTPDGQLKQLEFAKTAVQRYGGSCIGFRCRNGGLVAVARNRMNTKLVKSFPQKAFLLEDKRILIAVSGLLFEAPLLIKEAERICKDHRASFGTSISIAKLCDELSDIMHALTQSLEMRPIGLSLLVAGADSVDQVSMFTIEPDGFPRSWKATAIGMHSDRYLDALFALRHRHDTTGQAPTDSTNDPELSAVWPNFLSIIQSPPTESEKQEEHIDWEVLALLQQEDRVSRWIHIPPSDY